MAKQLTHFSGHILKPCPQELLWDENPSAYQAPIGSQACQNSSGAYPYARICKYFQLLSTETKAPESQGRSSAISSFTTIFWVFQVFSIPSHSCHFCEILVSEINLASLSKLWTLGFLCCIWNGWSRVWTSSTSDITTTVLVLLNIHFYSILELDAAEGSP